MPYVSSIERYGLEKGRKEGRGIGLLEGIELVLECKFGPEGLKLFPKFKAIKEYSQLRKLKQRLRKAESVDDVKSLFE